VFGGGGKWCHQNGGTRQKTAYYGKNTYPMRQSERGNPCVTKRNGTKIKSEKTHESNQEKPERVQKKKAEKRVGRKVAHPIVRGGIRMLKLVRLNERGENKCLLRRGLKQQKKKMTSPKKELTGVLHDINGKHTWMTKNPFRGEGAARKWERSTGRR